MRVVILNPGLRLLFFCKSSHFQGSDGMHAPFFWKDNTSSCSRKFIYFIPGGPPREDGPPRTLANTGFFHFFKTWGFFGEKVERQGKGPKNVWNYLNNLSLKPWVHVIYHWAEIHISKLKILKNHHYLANLLVWGESHLFYLLIMVIFQNFEFWNVDFCSMVNDMYSRF